MAKKAGAGSASAPNCQPNSTCQPWPPHRLESVPERAAHERPARQQTQADLPEVDGERRHLLLGALGISLPLSAPVALALTNDASAAAKGGHAAMPGGQSVAAPSYRLSLPLLRETHGAAGNETDDP